MMDPLRIRSEDSGKEYTLFFMDDGRILCDCPHFTNRLARYRGKKRCKHIDAWRAENVPPRITNIEVIVP